MRWAVATTAALALAWGVAVSATPQADAAEAEAHAGRDRTAATRAATWLARLPTARMPVGQQADIIVALRVAGARTTTLRPRLDRMARQAPSYARTPGAAAKIVMAAAAAGANPARLGRVDYVARMRRGRAAPGRFGTTAFDHGLAMIALRAAGRPVPRGAVTALRASRSGPGWNFDLDPGDPPDLDSTALSVIALRAAGVGRTNPVVRSATAWIVRARRADGGWTSTPRTPTNANSTALATRALLAAGRHPTPSLRYLRSLQERSGAVRHARARPGSRVLATIDAVTPLAGASLAAGVAPAR